MQQEDKQFQIFMRNEQKSMQTDIDTIKRAVDAAPFEGELLIRLHQKVLRKIRQPGSMMNMTKLKPPTILEDTETKEVPLRRVAESAVVPTTWPTAFSMSLQKAFLTSHLGP